jgi:malonyl-CoA/methylmalonyl-CoA synthetase
MIPALLMQHCFIRLEFAMALSNPYEPMSKRLPGFVGTPLPSVEVRIVDENNVALSPDSGNSGELQVRGPNVFHSYLNRPDVTTKGFASDDSGFFKTGDIACYDKENKSFKILGRASVDIIKNGG